MKFFQEGSSRNRGRSLVGRSVLNITLLQSSATRPDEFTACAIATSCCISDVPSQWENQKFDPPLLPHFQPIFLKLKKERYPGYDPAHKIWSMWDDGKGVCENGEFLLTFGSFFLFVLFASRPDHTIGSITTNEDSKRMFLDFCTNTITQLPFEID